MLHFVRQLHHNIYFTDSRSIEVFPDASSQLLPRNTSLVLSHRHGGRLSANASICQQCLVKGRCKRCWRMNAMCKSIIVKHIQWCCVPAHLHPEVSHPTQRQSHVCTYSTSQDVRKAGFSPATQGRLQRCTVRACRRIGIGGIAVQFAKN